MSYSVNGLNQYTGVTGTSTAGLLYEANGNLTSDGQWTYTYDFEDRLVRAVGGPLSDTITYDETAPTETVTEQLYAHANHQGSVIALSDGSGALVHRFTYGRSMLPPCHSHAERMEHMYDAYICLLFLWWFMLTRQGNTPKPPSTDAGREGEAVAILGML